LVLLATVALVVLPAAGARAQAPSPTAPPAQVCGNSNVLDGPSAPPAGAVTVPAGDNSGFDFIRPGATFWFAPGVHTLADDPFGQIIARTGATYIGGPGAVLDGRNRNLYAFTGEASNVRVAHLTIRNFGRGRDNFDQGTVNHDGGDGWIIENNTVVDNDGAGIFLGSHNLARRNCLKDNGQYGFSMFKPPIEGTSALVDITLDHNEIVGNNTDDWESNESGCGCTGAGKFWDVLGARVTNNWVHDNRGPGLWADTNNIDFLFEGNLIEQNDGEGLWYEVSYNATIRDNTFRRNAWVSGRRNLGSPGAAIYLSESGGEQRLPSSVSGAPQIRIYDNSFEDNFSGVSIYENANRFCNSNGNTSTGYCTPLVRPTLLPQEPRNPEYPNPISLDHPCYTDIANEPFRTDCRWHAKNIEVHHNDFLFDNSVVPCAGSFCGVQALYATGADNIPWSPYTVAGVQNAVMFENGNRFHDNRYVGNWRFAKGFGETIPFTSWRNAPYSQDENSTIEGETDPPPVPGSLDLDLDTSTLEGSIGLWEAWYSSSIERTTEAAHRGKHSLRVDVTAPYGWGVELGNWPGFPASHGTKLIGFWGKAGSVRSPRPTMTVTWIDAERNELRSDSVSLPALTQNWQHVEAIVDAPSGASNVHVTLTGTGREGRYLYLDDVVVGDAPNVLDAGSADFEGGIGRWQGWFGASASASAETAYRGTGSLKVSVTEPFGWGVQLSNWPGFPATPGAKRISYWGKRGSGAISGTTLRVHWYDAERQPLGTAALPLAELTTDWRQAKTTVTAPPGTATAYADILSSSGVPGDSVHVDEIVIADAPG
jgi:nitrous oxidase accessory protein NosD